MARALHGRTFQSTDVHCIHYTLWQFSLTVCCLAGLDRSVLAPRLYSRGPLFPRFLGLPTSFLRDKRSTLTPRVFRSRPRKPPLFGSSRWPSIRYTNPTWVLDQSTCSTGILASSRLYKSLLINHTLDTFHPPHLSMSPLQSPVLEILTRNLQESCVMLSANLSPTSTPAL